MRGILVKSILIALLAGALATLPVAVIFTYGMDTSLQLYAGIWYFALGMAASLFVGLPIAVLIFRLVKQDQDFGFSKLLLVANGTAIILSAMFGIWAGWLGVIFFGVPTFLAANVYAVGGWYTILRGYRA